MIIFRNCVAGSWMAFVFGALIISWQLWKLGRIRFMEILFIWYTLKGTLVSI